MADEDGRIPEGYILLARKVAKPDHWLWRLRPQHFKFAVGILLLARWRDGSYTAPDNTVITVKRGQYAAPFRRIAHELKLSVQNVRSAVLVLRRTGFLTHEVTHGISVITICNYERYQNPESYTNAPTNTKPTQGQHTKEECSNKDVKKTPTKDEARKYFADKLGNIAPQMESVIYDFKNARKTNTLAPSKIKAIVDYWLKFSPQLLLEAKGIWDEKRYAKEGMRENYFNGILRRLKDEKDIRRASAVGSHR